ncbi:three-helix bundle dimerization domain-containing protein [Rhodococcus aetherivorans]|uniref:three-helix bundle dimerization domain-containing protein n=1 Tax=Rhodococcus aetherivorans TaxID=191292 RepID=UPI0036704176
MTGSAVTDNADPPNRDSRPLPSASFPRHTGIDTPTPRNPVGSRPSEDETLQIELVIERLRAAFPSVPPADIDIAVRTIEKRFADAKIRTFVPLLIEKSAWRDIGNASRSSRTGRT